MSFLELKIPSTSADGESIRKQILRGEQLSIIGPVV